MKAGGLRPFLAILTHEGTLKGVPFLFNYSSGEGDALWCGPSPVSYARGLFFVVINGGQAQQGGSRLGEGPAHRTASLHALNKPKPLQQFEPIAQSRPP